MNPTINFWFWILFSIVTALTVVTWVASFTTPAGEEDPLHYLIQEQPQWMWTWLTLLLLTVVVSIIMFSSNGVVEMDHPFTEQGIFLFCASILLLSTFFINIDPTNLDKRVYKSHPIIFFTAAFFLVMCLVSSVSVNFKLRSERNYSLFE